jgi:RNA polymerase sigma-70 factor, ECF subfamily
VTRQAAATVGAVAVPARARKTTARPALDSDSREWLRALKSEGSEREAAIARLYELLLKAARFEVHRRSALLAHLRGDSVDDIASESASDALVSVLARLDDFRGESRFTTWAYKFGIFEAAVKLRRRAWQGREIPLEPERWSLQPDPHLSPEAIATQSELLEHVQRGIEVALTPHQRRVLVAVTLNDVPIDVLAERLGSNRNALYKTLHDARAKLRSYLTEQGLADRLAVEGGTS